MPVAVEETRGMVLELVQQVPDLTLEESHRHLLDERQ
jgi:hypothetical protein